MQSLESYFFHALESNQIVVAGFLALTAGLLTTFSPCVYPLIPITLSIIGARRHASHWDGFLVSASYVSGMVILYTILGITFASLGYLAGSVLQSSWITFGISLLFIAMAFSLFGTFNLVLPERWIKKLSHVGGKGIRGAFLMGLVAGLIAAPCTGPVMAFILTLIAKDGNLLHGTFLMLLYGIGMGLPFLLLGTFSSVLRHIPKSGPWMNRIKVVFGFVMLCAGVYYFQLSVLPLNRTLASLVDTTYAHTPGWQVVSDEKDAVLKFEHWLTQAKNNHQPVVIDFSAEWCQTCKELDKNTLSKSEVIEALARFMRIKIDMTRDSDDLNQIQERFGVVGLPTVLFINSDGELLSQPKLFGFVEANVFLEMVKEVE